ncbi:MAG: ATP-binding cassette domain-containing protein [Halanaerobiales bacterium]|nr:ATP-binding cassette domain-containing protein [Halanaerobiales bacterium]
MEFYYNKNESSILKEFNLAIQEGKILSILGESGSGKSTILRLIAGLEKPSNGKILIDKKVMNSKDIFVPTENRKVGMVFQDYALFPHMTVYENINFGISELPKKDKKEKNY